MSTYQAVPHSEILNLSSSENQIGEFFLGVCVWVHLWVQSWRLG